MLKLNNQPDEMMLEWVIRMPDERADEILVYMVAFEMRNKLKKKRLDGRHGWHSPNCSNADLKKMLVKHIDKGDMIDIINLAGMMLARTKLYGETA